jgi:rod shape-determining protein MreD
MDTLFAIPIIVFATMLQIGIVSQITLINGTADLVLIVIIAWTLQNNSRKVWFWSILAGVIVGYISAAPAFIPLVSYIFATGIAVIIKKRLWQTPLIAMFFIILLTTILQQSMTVLTLQIQGVAISFRDSLTLITLPSVLLNLLISIPVFYLIKDIARWLYPLEVENE